MVDKWLVFVGLQFVSATLWICLFGYIVDHNFIFLMVGGLFFTLGIFGATRWGFDKWRGKNKPRKREKKR